MLRKAVALLPMLLLMLFALGSVNPGFDSAIGPGPVGFPNSVGTPWVYLNVEAPLAGAPSDYHLEPGSPAIGMADTKGVTALQSDIDGDTRTTSWDTGADETTP